MRWDYPVSFQNRLNAAIKEKLRKVGVETDELNDEYDAATESLVKFLVEVAVPPNSARFKRQEQSCHGKSHGSTPHLEADVLK